MTSTSTSLSTGKRVIADWGTSNLRVYLVDESGQVLERRESEQGILNVHDGAFAATLAPLCSDWREAVNSAPILLAGMIGSRQGWVETPYAPCPARLRDLAGLSARVTGPQDWPVQIAPGVSLRRTLTDTTAQHQADVIQADVMRGEEVQVFGAAELAGVQVRGVLVSVYVLSGLICALAGWVLIGRLGSVSPTAGQFANIESITAVVIGGISLFGGRGSILGMLFGALIVGVFSLGLKMLGTDPQWTYLLIGALIIGAVAVDQWIRKVAA